MSQLNLNSAEEALRPVFARWQEADTDRPKLLRALLDTWGEAFWEAVPKPQRARVMYYLEKTGWQRPTPAAPVKTDFDKAIDFFKKGPWSRLTREQRMAVLEAYA